MIFKHSFSCVLLFYGTNENQSKRTRAVKVSDWSLYINPIHHNRDSVSTGWTFKWRWKTQRHDCDAIGSRQSYTFIQAACHVTFISRSMHHVMFCLGSLESKKTCFFLYNLLWFTSVLWSYKAEHGAQFSSVYCLHARQWQFFMVLCQ